MLKDLVFSRQLKSGATLECFIESGSYLNSVTVGSCAKTIKNAISVFVCCYVDGKKIKTSGLAGMQTLEELQSYQYQAAVER